jgi:signal peptidase I
VIFIGRVLHAGMNPEMRGHTRDVPNKGLLRSLLPIIETVVLTVVIFLVVQNFVAQPYEVKQQSMERTLEPGQYVLVDKLTPRFDAYDRGDIVVFRPPGSADETPFIKRVIGVPGDTLEIKSGSVWVNGHRLDESAYTFGSEPTEAAGEDTRFMVEPGTLFVMGDHRGNSTDSRAFGAIAASDVIGRAVLRYWPIDSLGILPTPTYPDLAVATN